MAYQAEYTGLRELEPLEQTIVKGITEQYLPRLERDAHNDIDLLVHVKGYNKGGHRSKYSVHLKLIYATNVVNVDNVYDWDLPKGVHKAFIALLNMLKKKFALDANLYKIRKSENKDKEGVKRRERYVQGNKRKMNARRRTKR
ncbi:hypothetical protein JXB27_01890 [Candidatus Woesearchaeota archaeon]|nr:hypothetical protein [Candidatus Woesearchaeota archaeon]